MKVMRRRWFSRRALGLHLVLLIWFPGCVLAGWWQATVAMSGNALSYLYAVEWPAFAIFGAVVWWNLIHDDPGAVGSRALRRAQRRAAAGPGQELVRRSDEEDPELAAYNAYLASLAEQGPKTWRRH
ncbi:MAG: hypothetical protein JWM85_2898 [Acidimicrobiaceae bacterium]|nr:hypothetical protein [Acidimicrobiaceae bacterium]